MFRPRFSKNVHILFACQALANTGTAVVATTSALAAQTIAADQSLVTLPLALQYLATMLSTAPASFLMRRIGRRAGFSCGAIIIITASLLSAYALAIASFPLFCVAGALIGSFNAFAMYYRFTAAEAAPEALRSKAISYVMAGGVVAAVCGPQLATWAKDVLAPVFFAGSYLVVAGLGAMALVLLRFVEVPGLSPAERRDSGRPLAEIARQPIFLVAVLGAMLGYSAMTTVMTATPPGHGRLRPFLRRHRLGVSVAHPRHVWPRFLHRPSHPALRRAQRHARLRGHQPDGGRGQPFLARPRLARARLELPLRQRHQSAHLCL